MMGKRSVGPRFFFCFRVWGALRGEEAMEE